MTFAALLPLSLHCCRPAAARGRLLHLGHRSLFSGAELRGARITCERGCVWLTHDGDVRDIVLAAGDSHVVDRDSRLIVFALEPARVRLAG
jgi:hypothetical protein